MKKQEIDDLYQGVETNITKRWEGGVKHHSKSIELYEAISELDYHFNSDSFCFKSGGDGDNGESLMYLLDIFFDRLDINNYNL